MTTTNVPSDQFADLKRDIEDATRYSNSTQVYINRVGKQIRPIPLQEQDVTDTLAAAEQAIANSGFVPKGDFTTGGTVEAKNEVFSDGADYWRYDGALPFTVTAGSSPTPTGVGAWLNVTDGTLRSQLADVDSTVSIAGTSAADLLNAVSSSPQATWNSQPKDFISCIPRVLAGGAVSFVDDAEHDTLGFSSVQQVGDFVMRVNYEKSYAKVNALTITIDDELSKYGVFTGGSVGIAFSDFTAYTQLRGEIDTTDLSWNSTGITPDSSVTVSYENDILALTHDNAAFNKDAVVVSQVYALSFMTDFGVSQSNNSINIIPYTELEGSVIYDGADFVFDPAKVNKISSTQTGITMAWDATVNALKVNHPLAGDSVVHVTAELGGYTQYNVEVNSLSSFRVYFFDSSGNQITAPNTNMKLMISRPSCQVRGKIPTGAKFNVRAGIIPIRSANLGAAPGNNFWVQGVMQK